MHDRKAVSLAILMANTFSRPTADGVDAERFRLRAERSLLRDAPLTTAEFTAQAPDS